MAALPNSPGAGVDLFDSSVPFQGVVVCCTSIPPEQRTEIAQKTAELGGIHKYDLTPDVTHLIVGEYDTPKYRHVAKERPDIKPMAAGWIEAVRALWVQDADIDFAALENAWRLKTFETSGGSLKEAEAASRSRLLCCMTGFEDGEQRQQMIETITANGADYTGDLTRKVTHLIVHKPEGKKYAAAKSWNVHTVSIEWLWDSVERGMILDEKCYDPVLPKEERGKGAWTRREAVPVSLGKRLRDAAAGVQEEGRRKLRKTASMKLSSQRDSMWGDILGKPPSAEPQTHPGQEEPTQPNTTGPQASRNSFDTQGSKLVSFGAEEEAAFFTSCCFFVHGFSNSKTDILHTRILELGGYVCQSLDDASSNSGAQMAHRLMIVPQNSRPASYPTPPDNVQVVTEFFIEKCIHKKQFFNPESHVIGRPFPVFPIPGFEELHICTAGFTEIDLNHVYKVVTQLGAHYEENFKQHSCSLLLCNSLSGVRKQKLELALKWKVPVVSANWLWTCITDGVKVPIKQFLFKELRQRLVDDGEDESQEQDQPKRPQGPSKTEPAPKQATKSRIEGVGKSAFAVDYPFPIKEAGASTRKEASEENPSTTSQFESALTHQSNDSRSEASKAVAPLSEASSDSLNKSSQHRRTQPSRPEPQDRPDNEAGKTMLDNDPGIADENAPPNPITLPDPSKPRSRPPPAALPAAERLALSARLTTLLDTSEAPVSITGAPATAPARRRRQILGRAISNVSAASSCSVDSSGAPGSASASAPADITADYLASVDEPNTSADRNLSSTQLEYEDPEAEAQKERLKGNKGRAKAPEKMTLASAGGYDAGAGAGGGARVGRAATGLRSRRR